MRTATKNTIEDHVTLAMVALHKANDLDAPIGSTISHRIAPETPTREAVRLLLSQALEELGQDA